ncbi:MAG: hypothetical protein IE931_03360 [Sphingobacteriales bacterium]|nr:hypothetical protein [Sphingobacteriales bacterium]
MKALSKDECKKKASEFLKGNVKEVHVTSDGQVFYNKNLATNHKDKRNLTLYSFPEVEEKEKVVVLTIAQLTEQIATITDKAVLEQMATSEKEGQNRTGALKAIEERISKITE